MSALEKAEEELAEIVRAAESKESADVAAELPTTFANQKATNMDDRGVKHTVLDPTVAISEDAGNEAGRRVAISAQGVADKERPVQPQDLDASSVHHMISATGDDAPREAESIGESIEEMLSQVRFA